MSTWTAIEVDVNAEEKDEAEDGGGTGSRSEEDDDHKANTGEIIFPWPQTLLANDLPAARVSSFGYDASVAKWFDQASQNRIGDHALNLLGGLASLRSKNKMVGRFSLPCPIINIYCPY